MILRLVLLLALALSAPAQDAGASPTAQPTLRIYGERDGLPNFTVQAITQDAQGRLWVATQDGAACYNGQAWKTFNLPRESRSNYIRTLCFDGTGTLWVGTQDDGLWQFRQGSWSRVLLPTQPPTPRINWITCAPSPSGAETLWVSTGGAGLLRWRDGAWRVFDRRDGLPHEWVWSAKPGPEGVVWAATDGGVAQIREDQVRAFGLRNGLPGEHANECLESRGPDGTPRVWASLWGSGLALFEQGRWKAVPFPSRYPVALAESTGPAGQPLLWVGTNDRGLVWREGEGPWRVLGSEQGLPSRGVYGMRVTGSRPAMWLGLREGGLASLDLEGFHRLPDATGRVFRGARHLLLEPAPSRRIWIGTDTGLRGLEGDRPLPAEALVRGLPNPSVNAMVLTRAFGSPRLVVATLKGIAYEEGGRVRVVNASNGLSGDDSRCLLSTREPEGGEALWVGSTQGLARFQEGRWQRWYPRDGLPFPLVYTLLETREGGRPSLWVGTRGGGVGRFREGRWRTYGLESGLPNLSVYALLEVRTPEGGALLLAGTFGGGLAWLDLRDPRARWQVLDRTSNPNLPSEVIVALAEDPSGRLYLGTPKGLVRLNPPWRGGHWETEVFGEGDGLPTRACSRGALALDPQGRLWVGTQEGVAWLDTRAERPLPALPAPILEGVRAAGRDLAAAPDLDLTWRDRPLSIAFALPFYLAPEATLFRTQILGLDPAPTAWQAEGRRELGFLPRGTYRVRIEARDGRGRVAPPLLWKVTVHPAPWFSAWAWSLYALAAAAGLWGLVRLRLQVLKRQAQVLEVRVAEAVAEIRDQQLSLERLNARLEHLNQEKNRMLGIAAHDLRNPLNAIRLYAQMLREDPSDPGEAEELAGKIVQGTDDMAELVRRLLDVSHIESGRMDLHPQAVDPQALAASLLDAHRARAQDKGIRLRMELLASLPEVWVDPLCLREILDNLLSNALKFTPPAPPIREVVLRLGPGLFEVQDEGPGFTEEDQARAFGRFTRLSARPTGGESSTGLGLSIVKTLAEAMGGRIELESRPGQGSLFRLWVPVGGKQ